MEIEQDKPSIAETARKCARSFDNCLVQTDSLDIVQQSLVEDQLARFSIWASNIGIFAPQKASMDHRLREAPEIRIVVISLLDALNDRVQQCKS